MFSTLPHKASAADQTQLPISSVFGYQCETSHCGIDIKEDATSLDHIRII